MIIPEPAVFTIESKDDRIIKEIERLFKGRGLVDLFGIKFAVMQIGGGFGVFRQILIAKSFKTDVAAPEWTGEGLPPAGTVCEYHANYVGHQAQYAQCEVIAHFDGESQRCAAYVYTQHDGTRLVGQGTAKLFRPLRTPEQIAADDRETAIENIRKEINWNKPQLGPCPVELMYDACYRKQKDA